jgi:hypothetical protein
VSEAREVVSRYGIPGYPDLILRRAFWSKMLPAAEYELLIERVWKVSVAGTHRVARLLFASRRILLKGP